MDVLIARVGQPLESQQILPTERRQVEQRPDPRVFRPGARLPEQALRLLIGDLSGQQPGQQDPIEPVLHPGGVEDNGRDELSSRRQLPGLSAEVSRVIEHDLPVRSVGVPVLRPKMADERSHQRFV